MAMLDPHRVTTVDWNGHILTEQVSGAEAMTRYMRRRDGEGVRYVGLFDPNGCVMAEYFRDLATHAYGSGWRKSA